MTLRSLVIALVMAPLVVGCSDTSVPMSQPPSDAGDEAFIKRVIPIMWGRKPSSIREVDILVQLIEQSSRTDVVYRMSRSAEFVERWSLFLRDHLGVFRLGDQSNADCYGRSLLARDDAALATHVRDTTPDGPAFSEPFTMVDIMRSSLWLDDVSPSFEAHLFAWLKQDYALPDAGAGRAARQAKSEVFLHRWLGRRMECLACHNSDQSVTDHTDPQLDRAWPVDISVERAVFGQSTGTGFEMLRPFFRRFQVVAGAYYDGDGPETDAGLQAEINAAMAPWGMAADCGRFKHGSEIREDDQGETGTLAGSTNARASIWDLERLVRQGFDSLRHADAIEDKLFDINGPDALAWMTSQHLVNSVWKEVYGHQLTIATWFPRTSEQRDTLASLTRYFVKNHYSLGALLAAISTSPHFNRLPPAESEPADHLFADIFDPWTNDGIPASERRNHAGDLVHRLPARVLLNSVYHALGWHPPKEFPETFLSRDAIIQRSAGVYLKDGDAGFGGIGFQAQLAWEDVFGACYDVGPCPLIATGERGELTESDLCLICAEPDTFCAMDDRCCDLELSEDICPSTCSAEDIDPRGIPTLMEGPVDSLFIERLLRHSQNVVAQGGSLTLRDVLGALKDRLLTDPIIEDPSEVAVIEALVGTTLDTPVDPADLTLDAKIRRVCGVWLATPDFQLWGWTGNNRRTRPVSLVAPGTEFLTLCQNITKPMYGADGAECAGNEVLIAR